VKEAYAPCEGERNRWAAALHVPLSAALLFMQAKITFMKQMLIAIVISVSKASFKSFTTHKEDLWLTINISCLLANVNRNCHIGIESIIQIIYHA